MIKINRGAAPEYMESEAVRAAKNEIESRVTDAQNHERPRFDYAVLGEVRDDLYNRFNHKCAYCETKISESNMGSVTTFRPTHGARGLENTYAPSHYWWLGYEWDNLLLACLICDQKFKRDLFPLENEAFRSEIKATGAELLKEKALLIDPCFEDPAEHLTFDRRGSIVGLTDKGRVNIEILGLNRSELVHARVACMQRLNSRLNNLKEREDLQSSSTQALWQQVSELFSQNPSHEYAALQRYVFNNWHSDHAELWQQIRLINNYIDTINYDNTPLQEISKGTPTATRNLKTELTNIKRFSIRRVEIENFKSIESISFNVKPVDEQNNRESWLLLLGDNGIGKSSILQAIALTLSSKSQLDKLNLDVLDYLRYGTESGKVTIHSHEHKVPIVLQFNKEGFRTNMEEAPTFILAYGSTRLLPKGSIQPEKDKEPYLNVSNLFDYSIALSDPSKWLSDIDSTEFNERIAPAFFDILALRGKDRIFIKNKKISIEQNERDFELEDNSDGYKTVTALVSDMMQTLSIDKANYHNSQGIVLIDEIGNHLHPRWRMKIAAALRKAFPNVQFIVTTHEPLCLRGLSHGEVAVLVRDRENKIKILESDLLPDHSMMRIDQLLTSDLFGLINVMDDEAEKTYEEYYALLSKKEEEKSEDDKKKIEELSSKLSAKEVLGNTPREQILFKAIDETIAQKLRDEGFRTQTALKKETIDEVKKMLINPTTEW